MTTLLLLIWIPITSCGKKLKVPFPTIPPVIEKTVILKFEKCQMVCIDYMTRTALHPSECGVDHVEPDHHGSKPYWMGELAECEGVKGYDPDQMAEVAALIKTINEWKDTAYKFYDGMMISLSNKVESLKEKVLELGGTLDEDE